MFPKKIKTYFHVYLEGEKMKLMLFTLHSWLKRLRGIINAITQTQNKTTGITENQIEFER